MCFYSQIILVYFLTFLPYKFVLSDSYTFEPPNLKTVLFKETDLVFHCWSPYDVNLLVNRRIMQDLIPRKIPRDLPLLLTYLKNVEDNVNKIPSGIEQTLLISAVGDVLGGYLQAIVIPVANEAYYAGNVDYATIAELHEMLNKWKWFLSTNGETWSQECDMQKIPTKVAVLEVNLHDPESACQELYVAPPLSPNETEYYGSQSFIPESSRIAIPYLDNNLAPNAIALPFRKRNLYSLMDPKAAYILVKYYLLSMRCLSGSSKDVLAFNNYFHLWIMSKVVPHLHDQDRWYPAFGAVMRVVETIKQKGLSSSNPVFVQTLSEDHQDAALSANLGANVESSSKYNGKLINYFHILNSPYAFVIIFAIFFAILMLIICCVCTCCYMRCRQKVKKQSLLFSDSDENFLKNAVISLYCGLKNTVSGSGSKLNSDYSERELSQQTRSPDKLPSYIEQESDHRPFNTPEPSDISLSVTTDSEEEEEEEDSTSYLDSSHK